MKKKIILLTTLFLISPINIKALEYESKLSGPDTISSMPSDEEMLIRTYKNLYIDITNIENIDSFNMYIKYDKSLIGLSTCNLLNYISEGCQITSDKEVYYEYKYGNSYKEQFKDNNFYRVGFRPIDATPESGTTTVEVYFKNAKDKEGNSITIKPSTKTYSFSKYGMILNNKDKENDKTKDNENSNNNIEQEPTTKEKSNNNFIEKLEIKNYSIKFDKYINNYSITIEEDINTLDIDLSLEDSKSTYKIIGADNLKENNYKVSIEVTSESKETNTYIINIKTNEKEEEKENTNPIVNTNKENKKDKKITINKDYIIIGILSIVLLIIISIIISNRNNRKINKMFNGL